MIDKKLQELINRDIDGDLSEKEKSILEKAFKADTNIKRESDDLVKLSSLLQNAESVDPPKHLRKHIMNVVANKHKFVHDKKKTSGNLLDYFQTLLTQKKLLPFLSGLALGGILLFVFIFTNFEFSPDNSTLTGTILLQKNLENIQTKESIVIREEKIHGSIDIKSKNSSVYFVISLNPIDLYELIIEFKPEQLILQSITPYEVDSSTVKIFMNSVRIQLSTQNTFILNFEKQHAKKSQVLFRIIDDKSIFSKIVEL